MNNISLKEKVEFYTKITQKFSLMSVYDLHYPEKAFQHKKLNREEILELWTDFLEKNSDPFLSLYVHVPFCKARCNYCIYPSDILSAPAQIDLFLDCLEDEINFFSPAFLNSKFTTLYIGGGTPSILSTEQLKRLFNLIFNNFKFRSDGGTKCIEFSPPTITNDKILLAKEKGIDRVSIGIQSLNPEILRLSNREYINLDSLKNIIKFVIKQDFIDFNVDLMASLPGDTINGFIKGLEKIMQLGVPSITIYFYRHRQKKSYNATPLQLCEGYSNYHMPYSRIGLLNSISGLLRGSSYTPIQINPNNVCQLIYRKGHKPPITNPTNFDLHLKNSTLGFGLYSQSFLRNAVEYARIKNKKYMALMYSIDDNMRKYILTHFERNSKVSIKEFKKMFKKDVFDVFGKEIRDLLKLNKIRVEEDNIVFLTKDIFEFSVYVKFFYNQEYLRKLAES